MRNNHAGPMSVATSDVFGPLVDGPLDPCDVGMESVWAWTKVDADAGDLVPESALHVSEESAITGTDVDYRKFLAGMWLRSRRLYEVREPMGDRATGMDPGTEVVLGACEPIEALGARIRCSPCAGPG